MKTNNGMQMMMKLMPSWFTTMMACCMTTEKLVT